MWILGLLAVTAFAGKQDPHWSAPHWFAQPILGGGLVTVGSTTVGQVTGGAAAGFRTAYKGGAVRWVDTTRAQGTVTYGVGSGSLGADVRVGSFVGPDWKVLALSFGPDVFFNGYGTPGSEDYHLPWSPGVGLVAAARLRIVPKILTVTGDVVPSWVVAPARQSELARPFHEATAGAAAMLDAGPVGLSFGVRRFWNAAGAYTVFSIGAGI